MGGQVIRRARQESGLSQAALAKRMDVDQQTVSKWELAAPPPPMTVLIRLRRELEFDMMQAIVGYWPELAAVDRLAELRVLLADASDEVLAEVVELTRGLVTRDGRGLIGEAPLPGSA